MPQSSSVQAHPQVAVIVAARNEEACIRTLLATLTAQNYPHERMQILLGNDRSIDATGDILEKWAVYFPNAQVVHIDRTMPGLIGKANVLAQLCRLTDAPYLLFTDADCSLPGSWVKTMVAQLQRYAPDPETDAHIVTGFTVASGQTAFALLQGVDWVASLSVIHALAAFGVPITAMGNNVACTQAAYHTSGGFDKTLNSLTEDYAFFQNILRAGGTFSHIANRAALIHTQPQLSLSAWLTQRKRWFTGALQLPWYRQIPFWFQALFYPLLFLVTWLAGWQAALSFWAGKVVLQSLLFGGYVAHLRLWRLLPWLLIYEFWSTIGTWFLLWAYIVDKKIHWKGQTYKADEYGHDISST